LSRVVTSAKSYSLGGAAMCSFVVAPAGTTANFSATQNFMISTTSSALEGQAAAAGREPSIA
jgi:hypothetical protein